jgi:MFS family permease
MSKNTSSSKFYGWWLVPVLCVVYSIPIGFVIYGPPVINTYMSTALGWQRGQINLGYSIIGIILGFSAVLMPFMINRFGPRKTIIIGFFITIISCLMIAFFSQVYPLYLALCFFAGIGVAFSSVLPIQTLVLRWFNIHRALVMGLVLGGGALGGFIYPQLITNSIIHFGNDWRFGWGVIAVACLIGAVIGAIAIRNRPEDIGQYPDGRLLKPSKGDPTQATQKLIKTYRSPINWRLKDAVKTPALWMIVVSVSFTYFLWQLILTQANFHLHDRGFVSTDPLIFLRPEFIYGLVVLCSIVGRLSISVLGEKFESRIIIGFAGFCLISGGILFWFISKDNLWATFLFPLLAGFGFGATYVSVPLIVGNYFGVKAFPSVMSIVHPVQNVLQYSAPFIAGQLYDTNGNYGMAIIISIAVALIGTVLILFCKPPIPKEVASI